MKAKNTVILIAIALILVLPAFAKTNGPTAQFQIKWHVENLNVSMCELKIKDYPALSDVAQDYRFNLVYTNEWQGLCAFTYKTNVVRQHHTLTLSATPLENGNSAVGYTLNLIVDDTSMFSYDEYSGWEHLDDSIGELITVPANQNLTVSDPIDYLAQHPSDINRKIVTALIPVRLRIDDLQSVQEGLTYLAHISLEVASP